MSISMQSYRIQERIIVCFPTGKCLIHKGTTADPIEHETNTLGEAITWCNEQNALDNKRKVALQVNAAKFQLSQLREQSKN